MTVLKQYPSEKAFGQLMYTLGKHAPRRLGQLLQLGKQTRALAGKPNQRKR